MLSILSLAGDVLATGLSTVASDSRHLSLEWSTDVTFASMQRESDWSYLLPNADWRPEGDAQIPVQVFLVACPIGSTPELSVKGIDYSELPVPLPVNEFGRTSLGQRRVAARITNVSRWRGFQIATVELRLAESTATGANLAKSIRLEIRFAGSAQPDAPYDREQRFLPGYCINGAQATKWWQLERPGRQALDNVSASWPDIQLYKLGTTEVGLYAMTADWLQLQGVPVLGAQSSQIRMFGNGGRLLPAGLLSVPDSVLREISIIVEDGGDGTIDQGDRVLFYGEGLKGYDYCNGSHLDGLGHASPYATENAFWIGVDQSGTSGLRMQSITPPPSSTQVAQFRGRSYLDQEQFIYALGPFQSNSGLIWYMATIDPRTERSFSINLENATTGAGKLKLRMDTNGGTGSNLVISVNGRTVSSGVVTTPLVLDIAEGVFEPGNNTVTITNNTDRQFLLNFIEAEFDRSLQTSLGTLEIQAPQAQTGSFNYSTNLGADAYVLDVTNPLAPRVSRGSAYSDSSYVSTPRRYFAANTARTRLPYFRGRKVFDAADYTRLRDVDNEAGIVIITYDDWYDALEPLIQMHADYVEEPLHAVRVKLSDIYDEFAWGVTDPTAIRNFLKYTSEYWRGTSGTAEPPRYVLFVGDGDFDYRNILSNTDDNWMPPWEDGQSCSDDYYVEFDNNSSTLEMISGRWPSQSESEVRAIVEKTVDYANQPLYGPWKNTATFVADDEWKNGGCSESVHTRDSENLINNVLPDYFTFRKIYEIFYPFRQSSSTSQKPDATRDLLETINNGTLLINYVGHGNERVWTDEQLFVMERDNGLIDNPRTWPVVVAGTCTWGGFDRPNERCFPELLLAGNNVGAVACIAATRYTFVSQNQSLTEQFYTEVFRQGIERRRSIGEAMLIVKPQRGFNNLYHTLGNPVLRLATPEYYAFVESRDDSLQAGGLFHLSGYVSRTNDLITQDYQGPRRRTLNDEVWSDFQGVVEARVFDSEDSAAYYFPNPQDCSILNTAPYYYGLPGNAIFRGRSSIVNGRFDVTFRVPRDIQYGGENAKVSLYFFGKSESENDSADGIGIERPLRIASEAAAVTDTVPPQIGVWLENSSFRSGDQVGRSPLLIVQLSDESGLNLSGEVGHKITVRVDDAQSEDITQFFNYDVDSYTDGELSRTIGPLSEGAHRLTVEAWDSFNNLNLTSLNFVVGESSEEGYAVRDVLNWPNPMASETFFTYALTQDGTSDVKIKIYTLTGKLVDEIDGLGTRQLYNSNSTRPWHGRDKEGHELANGVYFYKVIARHQRGYSAEATGKLVILR
ncbi:MAG: type IX secretion system sortase PorU [Calditrichaeota bacterium]|nr:type IX secretion system sortase PorU [Calditrichota bacterium]